MRLAQCPPRPGSITSRQQSRQRPSCSLDGFSSDVCRPRVSLTEPMASSAGTPIAVTTADAVVCPAWQADPVDAAT